MSEVSHILVDTCELVTSVRNEYGDYLDAETGQDISCRFREITTLERGNRMENSDADAMLWVEPDSSVVKGSVIKYDGVYYQVDKLYKARRLGNTSPVFIKCELKIVDLGIS
jgi:hypothetical protein